MTEDQLEQQLVDYLGDAHAIELDVEHVLASLLSMQRDQRMVRELRRHHQQAGHHLVLLEGRLEAYGHRASARKDLRALRTALATELAERFRGDRWARTTRDAYAFAHLEIATCHLLEHLATRLGDDETARVIRTIRDQELAMVARIDQTWDAVVAQRPAGDGIEATARERR